LRSQALVSSVFSRGIVPPPGNCA